MITTIEQAFIVEKKDKEDMVLANVQASSLMEDRKNQLVLNQSKLDSLLLALEQEQVKANLDASYVQTLNAKIGMERSVMGYYKFATDEGNSKFEKIHKEATNAHNNLGVLKE